MRNIKANGRGASPAQIKEADMAVLIRVDRNGTKYFEGNVPCSRCGGAGGADKWQFTGWKCYNCGGSGKQHGRWKEYTPEYEAKLAQRRQARREKWEAEHAEEIAQREAERKAKEEAERLAKEAAEKAISQYRGNEGDKIDEVVTYVKTAYFEARSYMGFGTETIYVHTFKDSAGNKLTWKTGTDNFRYRVNLENPNEWDEIVKAGDKVQLKGTIKGHNEYRDEKQTTLTRCKVQALA